MKLCECSQGDAGCWGLPLAPGYHCEKAIERLLEREADRRSFTYQPPNHPAPVGVLSSLGDLGPGNKEGERGDRLAAALEYCLDRVIVPTWPTEDARGATVSAAVRVATEALAREPSPDLTVEAPPVELNFERPRPPEPKDTRDGRIPWPRKPFPSFAREVATGAAVGVGALVGGIFFSVVVIVCVRAARKLLEVIGG